jgi:hypothetical protein
MTLAGLAGLVPIVNNNEPTHWWQGASGRWYVHTIYPIDAIPDFIRACNYIFARPGHLTHFDGTGNRVPLYIGESGEFDQRLDRHEKLGSALRLGATEIHIHLLAQSRQERINIETDLRHAHATPSNGQPTLTPPFLLPPPPSSSLFSLADLLVPSPPPSPPRTLADLFPLEALPRIRSRSSWNDRMAHWERPASDTEEQQIERAADMVRAVLSNNRRLNDEGVTIAPQGSYHNNTNVRREADMDLRAVHPSIRLEYTPNVMVDAARTALGIFNTGRTYSDVAQEMRRELISELTKKFGASNVDTSGNKAIRLKKQPGSRADLDIALTFTYYWVMWDADALQYRVAEGVAILGKDGSWTYNFPEQHHANGIAKRARTKHRFKRNVRILKTLRDELISADQLVPKQAPSFLIECLTYAIEDEYFLVETDDRYARALRILSRMGECLNDSSWIMNATEINAIKYLFRPTQPWTVDDAKAFVLAARRRIEA